MPGRSPTRATGTSSAASPSSAVRRTAAAAADSAAAIANRADTPDRPSTAGDSRTRRVNRAMTSIRCSGRSAPASRPAQEISASWVMSAELVGQRERVVGADLGPEPVLERRDDAAPVGVVLGVGARHQHDVERQPERVAADPDVALFEHVEQRHLDPLGQVGQLVEAEDAAVGPRHHAEVDGLRVAEGPSLGHLDRVDVADQVADAGVRGGELLAVPLASVLPGDREVLALLLGEAAAAGAHRRVRVVVDLAAGHDRGPLVEQLADRADEAGFALAALAQQDDVVPGEQGALHVGQHGLVEADVPGKRFCPARIRASRLSLISCLTVR